MSLNTQCLSCQTDLHFLWKFCPHCGLEISRDLKGEVEKNEVSTSKKWPERFVNLLTDYEHLISHALDFSIVEDFYNNPLVGQLSVVPRERRIRAGENIRVKLANGKFRLDLSEWLTAIYETPASDALTRVWTTSGGETFHSNRDCRGLYSGQNYARFKGKETYKPQFVTIREARLIRDLRPCSICKPKT